LRTEYNRRVFARSIKSRPEGKKGRLARTIEVSQPGKRR
jgi:hypothetical protein